MGRPSHLTPEQRNGEKTGENGFSDYFSGFSHFILPSQPSKLPFDVHSRQGLPIFDEHHRILGETFLLLLNCMRLFADGKDPDKTIHHFSRVVTAIRKAIFCHFDAEEKLMQFICFQNILCTKNGMEIYS
ncbi:MAG: hypothetical protein HQL88_02255 [Magnetococcales bacterium]|nr:hypothetical protein [Magnetococcales bacterium]